MPAGKPDAEVEIDETLVRRLLEAQHPALLNLPLAHLDSGWDNVLYRLGEGLVVRLPRREVAAQLLRNEQRWLPFLAPRLPLPVSAPVEVGEPTEFYPWHWSVCPFFEGFCADQVQPSADQAAVLAGFLLALHHSAPAAAPRNPVRGVPIDVRVENTLERMARVRDKTDLITPAIDALWQQALAAPEATDARWLHGDLHAQNVLVDESGTLSAIIDWGDLTAGDAATDLAGIWALFDDPEARRSIITLYDPDDAMLARACGWAVIFGVVLVDSGLINSPRHAAAGREILRRLQADQAA